ncbi:MAG: AhpC/TSA family protein [Prevotella sp.]|nr:AhpC/TSA family protein [Prevotella sp.]
MNTIFKAAAIALAAVSIVSCNDRKFHVEGNITEAEDSLLYLENVGVDKIVVMDSAKLGKDGNFNFACAANDAPEFYRLRIADQIINISIDSTETVTVKAAYPTMANNYEISGSDDCQRIKELTLKQIELHQKAQAIQANPSLGIDEANDSILHLIDLYKQDVANNYIYKNPAASSSYFALFQTLGNMLIFNPRHFRDDMKAFAAVATSWDTYYPGAVRGENLHNIALEGMKTQRIVDANNNVPEIDINKVSTTGLIDIQLPDNKGQMRSLTELKGKVVLLDFHVFAMEDSPKRILLLRELYNKYHSQGLEIYQVSLDPNEHFWKQQTAALPWISVRDENGIQSSFVSVYNVQAVPEFFLIDRDNNLKSRSQQITDIEQAIKALL